jgi:hypothetical protein
MMDVVKRIETVLRSMMNQVFNVTCSSKFHEIKCDGTFPCFQIVALQTVAECNLSRAVITMMKMLMTRTLAMEFTMTGLGDKRRPTKIKFDNSPACFLVE